MNWYLYVPGVVIVLGGAILFRWAAQLQRRMVDHAERISRLEGRNDGPGGEGRIRSVQ